MGKLNWLGEFCDSRVEQAFQQSKWHWFRIRLLVLYLFIIITYLTGVSADFHDLGMGADFRLMLGMRSGGCLLAVFAFILLLVDKSRITLQYVIMSVCMLSFAILESMELAIKYTDIGSLSLPSTVFMVLAYYVLLPPRIIPSLVAGICGSLFYLISLSSIIPVQSGTFINSALYFFLANSFGMFFLSSFGISLRREHWAHNELKKLVEYDELTGVYSRRRVLESGENLFRSACRFRTDLAVLMMDIDHFKKVNDDYGHHAGDEVLRETASRCSMVLRDVDCFGRLGGEEFVVLLPQANLYHGLHVAERLRSAVGQSNFIVGDVSLPVSVSIGVAELREQDNLTKLLQDADSQLYRAKKCGRNQVSPVQWRVLEYACP